jgi:septal ring factor EnvC (AmiA/AmiB activator)
MLDIMSEETEQSKDDYIRGAEHERRMRNLQDEISELREQLHLTWSRISDLSQHITDLRKRIEQLEKPKMTADEALKLYDELKRLDPKLTLTKFAARYGLGLAGLRKARWRRQKKNEDVSTK